MAEFRIIGPCPLIGIFRVREATARPLKYGQRRLPSEWAGGVFPLRAVPPDLVIGQCAVHHARERLVKQTQDAADEAIAMIRDVTLEQTREKYFSVHFYDALSLAISQFTDNTRSKSLLVISEGNDYFPRKTFKETVARAQQLQAACDVAMVADHTLYGTKGIQRYGFHLRRLAGKTHGQYIEVGAKQKRVARSVERLSDAILNQ